MSGCGYSRGTPRYHQMDEKLFKSFSLHMYIKMRHFYSGRMVSGDCKNLTFWYPYVKIGTPKSPQVVKKYFLFVFYSYLHHFEPFLLWSDAIWWDIKNSTFRHPCVVVITLRYPQMVKKYFFIVFLAYFHHFEYLFLWSDAIWWDFKNSPFGVPAWS